MPCKTLCLGASGFRRSWKYGNKANSSQDPSWLWFSCKAIQFGERNPFWLLELESTVQGIWFSGGYVCHLWPWWWWRWHVGPCWYASSSTSMWVSQTYLLSNLYCLFQNNWQLISINSLFPFFKKCTEDGRQNPLHWWCGINLSEEKSSCLVTFLFWALQYLF